MIAKTVHMDGLALKPILNYSEAQVHVYMNVAILSNMRGYLIKLGKQWKLNLIEIKPIKS